MARYTANQVFRISTSTFDSIDGWIRAAEKSGRNIQYGLNALAMLLARTHLAFTQELSRGPVDPSRRNQAAAWKIPVRRISGRYHKGWKAKRLAPGMWLTYNDSREAYFIEYGINHLLGGGGFLQRGAGVVTYRDGSTFIKGTRRVRRPVRKMALIRTMRMAEQSRVYDRVLSEIWSPFDQGRHGGAVYRNPAPQAVSGMRRI